MRAEANKPLGRQMADAMTKAIQPVKVSIKAEAEKVMPHGGGYRHAFTASLRFRTSRRVSGQRATVILLTYADGKGERRDIRSLEKGNLRHPVFGRHRHVKFGVKAGSRLANPWSVTKIRAGFHRRGTDHAIDHAKKELVKVIDDYARRLVK